MLYYFKSLSFGGAFSSKLVLCHFKQNMPSRLNLNLNIVTNLDLNIVMACKQANIMDQNLNEPSFPHPKSQSREKVDCLSLTRRLHTHLAHSSQTHKTYWQDGVLIDWSKNLRLPSLNKAEHSQIYEFPDHLTSLKFQTFIAAHTSSSNCFQKLPPWTLVISSNIHKRLPDFGDLQVQPKEA